MGMIFSVFIIVAGALLLPGSLASAASPTFCAARFAPEAGLRIQKVRALGGCGQDMNDPFWSANQSVQIRWCYSVDEDTARTRIGEIAQIANKCDYCRVYATSVATAAAENIKYSCGFKHDGDERWKPDRTFHFDGCIKFCSVSEITSRCNGDLPSTKDGLNSILVNVTSQAAQCKADRNIGTSSSPLTVPKAIPPLRDSVGRVKHPGNTSTKSHNDLAAPARPSNRRTTARETAITAKHDHTPPPARARSRPPNPCKSATATKPCSVGTNTSAMDRLSGASPLPASSRPGEKSRDGGSGRVPASGETSAVAKPVTTPAALPKADPTTDFGKCASCGKPISPPR